MKELYKAYQDLFMDKEKWNYYSNTEFKNPFSSYADSKRFVYRFIERSGKAEGNLLYANISALDEIRIKHIVSVFFFGTFIYYHIDSIKAPIDKIILRFREQNPYSKIEFSFIWFLICIFHDLGYTIEEKKKIKSFDEFISNKVKYFLNQRVGVPKVYGSIYKNYFEYRLKSKNKNIKKPDHGICGGVLLFNELNKILKVKQRGNFIKGLSWNKKLVNIYRYASWVILSHNIFFIRFGDYAEKEYIKNNLQELILSEEEISKVDYRKHSFLFLFMLVDSIDPVKALGGYDALKQIKIKTTENEICFSIDNSDLRKLFFKKVNSLKSWLTPIIIESDKTIKIIIK